MLIAIDRILETFLLNFFKNYCSLEQLHQNTPLSVSPDIQPPQSQCFVVSEWYQMKHCILCLMIVLLQLIISNKDITFILITMYWKKSTFFILMNLTIVTATSSKYSNENVEIQQNNIVNLPTVISCTDLITENHADVCSVENSLSFANLLKVKEKYSL